MIGLCRLCASLRKIDALTTVKDECNEICEKLRNCCQINIMADNSLPKSICQECITSLNNAHRFYMKVQEAQEALLSLYPFASNQVANASLQQTLTVENKNLKQLLSIEELDELNSSFVHKKIEGSFDEEMQIDNHLLEQSKALAIHLRAVEDQDTGQVIKSLQEMDNEEQTIFETLETIEDNDEDLIEIEQVNDPHYDAKKFEVEEQILNESDVESICGPEKTELEDQILSKGNVQYDYVISDEEDMHTTEVVKRINELLSDDEVNLEIEYTEYLENEEENDVMDKGEAYETIKEDMNDSIYACGTKISSWEDYKYLCFICDKIFESFGVLKTHIACEHNIKELGELKYKCYDCKKIIQRYSYFLNHVRASHHPDLKLRCDACDLSFQNFQELSQHRCSQCTKAKNYVQTIACSICFKSFNNTFGLQHHIKFQHNPPAKETYKCTLCNKQFQFRSCLKSHELLHTDIKEFSCDYCDKSFHTKIGLEQHLYTHVAEKAFMCNICNKSYKTSRNLDDHRKLHTEEKSFKCQYCSKAFSRKIQKITHERNHTGEKPFTCEHCAKQFRNRSALFVHNKTHTGSKPYLCNYCPKTFSDSSNRNKHVRRMHSNDKILENKSS